MANRIVRTSQYLSGYGILTKAPKNKTSFCTISITEDMVAFLSEYLAWLAVEKLKMGDLWKKEIEITEIKKNTKKVRNNRIFIHLDSSPIFPDSITQWTEGFVRRHQVPPFTPHSLRHTNVMLQIAAGVPIRTVAERADHIQTSTTTNIYAHALKSADEAAAETMNTVLKIKSKRPDENYLMSTKK